ncbi:transmembrane channel-like protein 7 isoform X2 [Neocloeon triangulifer]|uniref:transmembrane channel-like protein 7 isoform X2 n=1 Tax=Neocloeon triangulifer TaxID=2078957 RepID=UPI00286F9FD2|nr:transmembrane channel-like protein 7 isoform X2 [Neocloeon triangulifer]
MSGSGGMDRKNKKSSRAQVWEEAGGEFYQESYPGASASASTDNPDSDAVAHRDAAAHLATLLPSKQAQHTMGKATTRRSRNEGKQSTRKRTGTRSRFNNTVRRESNIHDIHISLPDFSVENIPNEERTWEEIMQIKAMPVNMAQKRELKAKLKSATKLRLQGLEQLKWQRRKFWQQCKSNWKEFYSKMELWQGSLKTIEGNFGIGVVSYFLFVKWLMFLNIIIFALTFFLIVLPTIVLERSPSKICNPDDRNGSTVECCALDYDKKTSSSINLYDLVQGTGWMERTLLFYGYYADDIYTLDKEYNLYYDLPFAYVVTAVLYFLVSLIAIVKSAARGFRERIIEGEGQFYQYCNLVFGGWDFCIDKPKGAENKHKAIFNEIKGCLETEKIEAEKQNRSKKEKCRLLFSRTMVNIGIIILLLLSMLTIYFVFTMSRSLLEKPISSKQHFKLFFEYMPSLVIVSLNLLLPLLFSFLVTFEHYSPIVVVRISLMRTIFLRLSSLMVLGASIYRLVSCDDDRPDRCTCQEKGPLCWETYVGQQFYKLAVTNALTGIAVTFFVNFPRAMLAQHFENYRFFKFIGEQQFELPNHVLDVVYSQTLCWIGSFYSPLLPAFATIHCFLTFYVKKFACLINSRPPSQVYRTSRSNYMFMAVLLVSFVSAAIAVGYSMAEVVPSRSCGPFKGDEPVWTTVWTAFYKLPSWIQNFIFFLGTAGFTLPTIVVLLLALYYYNAVTAANRQMVLVLRRQLVLEGHDKQFLLSRLSTIIKQQQQERLKNNITAPPPPEFDTLLPPPPPEVINNTS